MEDIVFDFDVAECSQTKLTKIWGISLVNTMKESLAEIATSINTMNRTITRMATQFNDFESKMTTMSNDVKMASDKAESAHELATDNGNEIKVLFSEVSEPREQCTELTAVRDEVQELRTECRKLREENVSLRSQTNNIESYSCRDNLIIYGIPEAIPESTAQCKNSVREFFVNHMNFTNQESTGIDFIRCHRTHTTRQNAVKPIIVRFKNSSDREKVWLRKSAIKDRNLNICEDFPKSIAYNRRKLFPVFAKARKLTGIDKSSVSIKGDVLFIRGKRYTVDNLDELDGELSMDKFNERSNDSTIVFGGMYSNFHPLSNYYQSQLLFQNRKYSSIEQAYQHQKALIFDDQATADQIMDTHDPSAAKRLSFKIKGFKEQVWKGKRYDIMLELTKRKFIQNPNLATALLATGTKRIAESGKHRFFAVGLPITHKDILNEGVWTGESKLGGILMVVRDKLNSSQ